MKRERLRVKENITILLLALAGWLLIPAGHLAAFSCHDLTVTASPPAGGLVSVAVNDLHCCFATPPCGISCSTSCSVEYNWGEAVTLTATPNPGYTFDGWFGGALSGTANPTSFTTSEGFPTVTAKFVPTPNLTLTVSISPEGGGSVSGLGISCPGRCSYTYSSPITVTLEATPAPCYAFTHWTGDGLDSPNNPLPLVIDADKQVNAHFERRETIVLSDPMASPDKIPADGSTPTSLTVKVTYEGDPPSVSIDLSPLGRSSNQVMYDDGTNGDAMAGDGIYSIRTTAKTSTPIAMKALKVTATDSCNSGIAVIKLFVTSLITGTVQPQGTNSHIVNNTIAGQTLNIFHQLLQPSGYQIMQNGETTITVKNPDGQIIVTENMSASENSINLPNAAAGNWTYEVSNAGNAPLSSRMIIHQNTPASYQIETVTGGLGIIVGTVTNATTQANLTGILMSTDTGGASITVEGNYVMVAVAGVFTVTAASLGYERQSIGNVTLSSGATVTVDVALTPVMIPFNVSGVRTYLLSPPRVGSNVQTTILLTRSDSNPHYRWLWNTVPFTVWQTFADWTLFNDSEPWAPASENRFVVLAHAAEVGETTNFHQGGLLFETDGNSANPIQIIEFTSDLDYPQPTGTPITLNAKAGGGSGQLYFKFLYRLHLGGWTEVGDWNVDGEATWTPQQGGVYTIVVHVSKNNTVATNPLNQAGMTFAIE